MKFKKIDKEFLLTDSTLNSYSYRLLTAGYQLADFQKNPIGYFMHGTEEFPREMGVLVKWEDLRSDGDKVYGKPCINLDHPRGERTVNEVEGGFLNAASVGHLVALEISTNPADYLPGQKGPTVSKWFNREASLVDIPGNFNALTDLVDEHDNPINLADFSTNTIFKMKQIFLSPAQLALIPNLKADPAQDEVDVAISNLVAKAAKADTLQASLLAKETELSNLKAETTKKEVTAMLTQALNVDKKINKALHDLYAAQYADKPTELKAVLDATTAQTPIVKMIKKENHETGEKTWDEMDAAGELADLKANDPEAYKALYKKEFGSEPTK